jgi:hypothetical protein
VSARTAAELREALEAVREALGIPHAATAGDDEKRAEILQARVMHALLMIGAVLDEERGDAAWSVAYCRERLAEHPATGYRTWDEVVAGQQAAKAAAPGGAA